MEEESIDDILSSLAASYKKEKKSPLEQPSRSGSSFPISSPSANNLDKLLQDINVVPVSGITEQKTKEVKTPQIDNDLLKDLDKIQTDLKKEKIERAKAWLKELDPLSAEGLWFKEFAKHFASELDAALDYLQ